MPADGFNVGKMVEGQRRQTQLGNAVYTIIPLNFPLKAVKAGSLALGPVTASVMVAVPSANRRRDLFDPFGMFGRNEQKQLVLATEPENLQSLPLPRDRQPADFNGAVGNYTMTATAGPTNVSVGDPITVKVLISGQGSLDSLTLPEQSAWKDFKTYPSTSKVDTSDPFGLQGTKTFEQIVVPQSPEIKELPAVTFSFFDPDQKAYRTLAQPAVPLVVRPGGASAAPTVLAANRSAQDNPPPSQDIVGIKQRLGAVALLGPPLVQQPWFLTLQGVPVLAFISALVWRKRTDTLANNPRLRRHRQVAQIIRDGLQDLRRLAKANNSDEFFATLFRLLQEQLGERLDLPASAITEAVIEERLRPRGVPETTLAPLQELFQTCNLARYAPIKSSQELEADHSQVGIRPPRPPGAEGMRHLRLCTPCVDPGGPLRPPGAGGSFDECLRRRQQTVRTGQVRRCGVRLREVDQIRAGLCSALFQPGQRPFQVWPDGARARGLPPG